MKIKLDVPVPEKRTKKNSSPLQPAEHRRVIDKNTCIVDSNDKVVAYYWHDALEGLLLETLEEAIVELLANLKTTKERSARGKGINVLHLGVWARFSKRAYLTKKTRNLPARRYLNKVNTVLKVCEVMSRSDLFSFALVCFGKLNLGYFGEL
jgi:hypothetical protein